MSEQQSALELEREASRNSQHQISHEALLTKRCSISMERLGEKQQGGRDEGGRRWGKPRVCYAADMATRQCKVRSGEDKYKSGNLKIIGLNPNFFTLDAARLHRNHQTMDYPGDYVLFSQILGYEEPQTCQGTRGGKPRGSLWEAFRNCFTTYKQKQNYFLPFPLYIKSCCLPSSREFPDTPPQPPVL